MATKVSLVPCPDYDQARIETAVKQCLNNLGGISHFVKPGQTVLIKPNALMSASPGQAVTTHPALIAAVVKEVVRAGGKALVGDSPGNAYSNVPLTMEKTGIKAAAEQNGGKIVFFQQDGTARVASPSGNARMPQITLARIVREADVIINLPKLKTHGLTLYTGAVKNMFGAVPGFYKASYHSLFPKAADFAAAIVDIYETAKPALNIMDAVVGMEGHGPNSGDPRRMGLLIASADGVALDAVGAWLIGYSPERILTTRIAAARGLGEMAIEKLELSGPPPEKLRQPDWKKSFSSLGLIGELPDWALTLLSPLLQQVRIYPRIDQSKCTQCLVCFNNCPAKTIEYDKRTKRVTVNRRNCINCFCCHELCQYKAIRLERSWLVKLLGLG